MVVATRPVWRLAVGEAPTGRGCLIEALGGACRLATREDRLAVWNQFLPSDVSDAPSSFGCRVRLQGEFYTALDGGLDAMFF
ncbi:hypothetical protein DEO72_LG6g828 [Vigna unguiculata]|uniref:Uncharacterized protein n=1 Tax=Vigna unguiculata TaxID=3917 RepID=A0A4D6M7N8_VIGUN|nr:hypothetical protein DEO72_LG6g828 [Vigna unguiculata]